MKAGRSSETSGIKTLILTVTKHLSPQHQSCGNLNIANTMLFQFNIPFNKDVTLQTQNTFTDSTDADTGGRAVAGIAGSIPAGA
jgi:hypothetical protein